MPVDAYMEADMPISSSTNEATAPVSALAMPTKGGACSLNTLSELAGAPVCLTHPKATNSTSTTAPATNALRTPFMMTSYRLV
jgi:hypothetical protein